jgi:nucleotide-binding universal stress UspA family protein
MRLLSLKSILVAVDLDEASIPALRTAARLADLAGAELHLLHVRAVPDLDGGPRLGRHFRDVVEAAPVPDSVEEIVGLPAAVIVQHALKVKADAILLGPHRQTATDERLGSTASAVVNTASCPCLILANELRLPLQRVIAPIDISNPTGGSLSVALTWASALRPRTGNVALAALHVTNSASGTASLRLHEEIEQARVRAGGASYVHIREMITSGDDPAKEILRTAESEHADLVVAGTTGGRREKAAMGSVSAALARVAPCPLLLVPPITWQEQG